MAERGHAPVATASVGASTRTMIGSPEVMTERHPRAAHAALRVRRWLSAAGDALPFVAFAALGLLLLLWRVGADPPYPHNWEDYTARHLFAVWEGEPDWPAILTPTDGLMTGSGR